MHTIVVKCPDDAAKVVSALFIFRAATNCVSNETRLYRATDDRVEPQPTLMHGVKVLSMLFDGMYVLGAYDSTTTRLNLIFVLTKALLRQAFTCSFMHFRLIVSRFVFVRVAVTGLFIKVLNK